MSSRRTRLRAGAVAIQVKAGRHLAQLMFITMFATDVEVFR